MSAPINAHQCTGAGDHIPWYSKASLLHAKRNNAIVIAPDYPLGPEGNYEDIANSLQDFLIWYKNDGFFKTTEEPYDNWTTWLAKESGTKRIDIDKDPVFIEGESAGGNAAVTAMFLNAHNVTGPKLPIKVVLLRYPMLKHYTRSFEVKGQKVDTLNYMGEHVTKAMTISRQKDFEREIFLLEKHGLVPTRSKGFAPQWMAPAFILSTTQRWKPMFQRVHGPYSDTITNANDDLDSSIDWPASPPSEQGSWDALERLHHSVDTVSHANLPVVVMYHGNADANCPISDTREFQRLLVEKYPDVYDSERAYLYEVAEFLGVDGKKVTDVGHAFDYVIEEKDEGWLGEIFGRVDGAWLEG